jgi:hypothetical protein
VTGSDIVEENDLRCAKILGELINSLNMQSAERELFCRSLRNEVSNRSHDKLRFEFENPSDPSSRLVVAAKPGLG